MRVDVDQADAGEPLSADDPARASARQEGADGRRGRTSGEPGNQGSRESSPCCSAPAGDESGQGLYGRIATAVAPVAISGIGAATYQPEPSIPPTTAAKAAAAAKPSSSPRG